MTQKTLVLFLICSVASWSVARADEETRQVQEELRKRHLFFRDIDGKPSAEYSLALKQYQQRQGFAQTGRADEMTLYSLGIGEPPSPAEGAGNLPDIPVLKSDAAVHDETRPKAPPVPTKAQNAGDVARNAANTALANVGRSATATGSAVRTSK